MRRSSSQANHTIKIAIGAIIVIFAIFVIVLWRAHLFTFTGSDSSLKVVAESLALVGGLVTAIGSILGLLLKNSVDSRAEDRAEIEADRAHASKKNEEKRLQLDSAIQAVRLFATNDGKETPAIQQAGALFALASLDQHELTIQLASKLLAQKKLDASTACNLVDQAFRYAFKRKKDQDPQDDEDLQIDAVTLLVEHASQMVTSTSSEVPKTLVYWDAHLSHYVREWAPIALGKMVLEHPLPEWKEKLPLYANVIVATLACGFRHEPDPELKSEIGAILKCLLLAFPELDQLNHPSGAINTKQLREEVHGLTTENDSAAHLVANLNKWIQEGTARQGHAPDSAPPVAPQ
jgi:hypothetical protein